MAAYADYSLSTFNPMVSTRIPLARLFLRAITFCCFTLPLAAHSQQPYNICEVYQFLDNDSSYLEKIAIKEYSDGHIVKQYSIADMENNDSYTFCKKLKGDKIFKGGDTTKLQEVRRFNFVTSTYRYDKAGRLQYALRTDESEGIFSHENSIYHYGQGNKPSEKYDLDVSHDLIQGVTMATYAYDDNGRIMMDSSAEDRRLVANYQWDDKNIHLLSIDESSMSLVPVSPTAGLNFRFVNDDTINRRMTVKRYRYFDGGFELRSSAMYYFTGVQDGMTDSIFTDKNNQPVKCIRRYTGKLQFIKSYYYNGRGDLARVVVDSYEGDGKGRITRIYKYLTKKAGNSKK